MAPRKYTSEELIELLRKRFGDKQRYALFEQVANGTGWQARSWIDALLLCLWPSDGLRRVAFEIKVSRSDFLAELKNFKKNEWAREMCHEFWFVAPSNVIKEEELPEGCGWMRPHGNTLAIVRHAQRTKAEGGDELIASIARSMQRERDKEEGELRKKILADDEEYQEALAFRKKVEAFCRKNGKRYYHSSLKDIEEILSDITVGDRAKNENLQVRVVLDKFQRNMADLFDNFLGVAHLSMVEVDDLGNFIMGRYGDNGEALLIAEKRALAKKTKKGKRHHYGRENAKRVVGALDRMRRLKEAEDAREV